MIGTTGRIIIDCDKFAKNVMRRVIERDVHTSDKARLSSSILSGAACRAVRRVATGRTKQRSSHQDQGFGSPTNRTRHLRRRRGHKGSRKRCPCRFQTYGWYLCTRRAGWSNSSRRRHDPAYASSTRSSPNVTLLPSLAFNSTTLPERGASISFSIFMASSITMGWPAST